MKVAVLGAGAAGLMVSGLLAQKHNVTVFDKNEKAGKKLYITGKGRCNLTNLCTPAEFLDNVVRGKKFLQSAINGFSSFDAVDFFENLGLATKVERGNRVFPQSDKSSDVIKVLKEKHCKNVQFRFGEEVFSVKFDNFAGNFVIFTKKGKENFDRVVVATGGKSYVSTGSDGAGYKFAKSFGHNIVSIVPALCPIKIKDRFVKDLQGVSLKNVALSIIADEKKYNFFGEMLFTSDGISGPIVLTASSFVNRAQKVKLSIDFKPALSVEQLSARVLREFDSTKNKDVLTVVKTLLPKSVAEVFVKRYSLENLKVHSALRQDREKIVENLKNFALSYGGLYDLDSGIVTSGGVDITEINPKTFESKLQNGLYFVGEVLDVDALTGGFNLQIAWATAQSCARNFK